MKIKKFKGDNITSLFEQIKAEMGEDVVILDTILPSRKKSLIRLFGKPKFIVVAAKGVDVPSKLPQKNNGQRNKHIDDNPKMTAPKFSYPTTAYKNTTAELPPLSPAPEEIRTPQYHNCNSHSELTEIKSMLKKLELDIKYSDMSNYPAKLFDAYVNLVENAVSDKLARSIVHHINSKFPNHSDNEKLIRDAVRLTTKKLIKTSGPLTLPKRGNKKLVFIGPTGVGKTTTIAKLASQFALSHAKVGLITVDTYRIAAAEQLKRTAEIMRIPVKVVDFEKPVDIKNAIKEFSSLDLTFIDTAGRSQLDNKKMIELNNTIQLIQPDEVHLVLSITTDPATMRNQIERFASIKVDNIVLTKLDEAAKFGQILDISAKISSPLSYVTSGQIIPDDIEPANSDTLSKLILGEHSYARPS